MRQTHLTGVAALMTVLAVAVAACGGTSSARKSNASPTAAAGQEQPVAAEKNPPGDIPDNQAFVQYRSGQGGYQLDAPEGWGRTETTTDVSFIDKLNGERVTLSSTATAPTVASARTNEVPALEGSGRAVQVATVKDVKLPGGPAVLIDYTANSEPDPVTSKQVRLENQAYLFFRNGKLATLTLWAPQGADNVDQWQRIANSFRWV